jgi:DoxX-like family
MKPIRLLSWALALGFAAALVFLVGLPKFVGPDPNPIFALIAGRTGVSLFEPYVRYATGVAELTAALLLIIPRTRFYGALLAGGVTLGAIGFHLSPFLGVQIPQMDRLVALLQEGRSVSEIDAMALPTDGGTLFMMALAFFAVAVALAWLERPRRVTV